MSRQVISFKRILNWKSYRAPISQITTTLFYNYKRDVAVFLVRVPAARNPNNPILSDSAVWGEDAHGESCVLEARHYPSPKIVACLQHAATDITTCPPHYAPLRYAYVGLLGYRAFSTDYVQISSYKSIFDSGTPCRSGPNSPSLGKGWPKAGVGGTRNGRKTVA